MNRSKNYLSNLAFVESVGHLFSRTSRELSVRSNRQTSFQYQLCCGLLAWITAVCCCDTSADAQNFQPLAPPAWTQATLPPEQNGEATASTPASQLASIPWESPPALNKPDPRVADPRVADQGESVSAEERLAFQQTSRFPTKPIIFDPHVSPTEHVLELSPPSQAGDTNETLLTADSNHPTDALSDLSNFSGRAETWFENIKQQPWARKLQSLASQSDTGRVVGSLALVLGLYFAFVWVMRKFDFRGSPEVPVEVLEFLGQVPFGARNHLQLVRLGSKLLLLMTSPEGTQPIGEITEPAEVDYLASLCSRKKTGSNFFRHSGHVASRPATDRAAREHFSQTTRLNDGQPHRNTAVNLADVIRSLETASQPNRTVYEA